MSRARPRGRRRAALLVALAAAAGCSIHTSYRPDALPARLVVARAEKDSPVRRLELVRRDGVTMALRRLAVDGSRVVVEEDSGLVTTLAPSEIAVVRIQRWSGGTTILAIFGWSILGLLVLSAALLGGA